MLPGNPQTAYAVYNGFNTHTPGAPGHVFKTRDGGNSWQDISSNLPDVPALSIVLDREQPGVIFIGTDTGVFKSENDGASWLPFNNGMPTVAVVDLALNSRGTILYAATHGRSIFRVVLEAGTAPGASALYLPLVSKNPPVKPPTPITQPTNTPTATPTLPPPNTPTATFTPVTPQGTALPTQEATPTFTPSATPLPTNTPAAGEPIEPTATPVVNRFRDDFANANSGWEVGANANCSASYANVNGGIYRIASLTLNQICISPAPQQAPANGSYAVRASKESTGDGSVYGLVFGLDSPTISNNSQFYLFYVDPADQTYALYYQNRGSTGYLTGDANSGFVFNSAIVPDSGSNELRVRREGGRIDLFVNERYLATINDNTFAGNRHVGVANWRLYSGVSTAAADFDDFTVNAIGTVYQENYGDVGSGWAVGDISICQAAYGGGVYRTASRPDFFCWFISPSAPQQNGRFRATMRREPGFYPLAYGVVAGFAEDSSAFYALLVIPDEQRYALAKYIEGESWYGITWNEIDQTAWLYSDVINGGTFENDLELERDGDLLRIYINGRALGGYRDDAPLAGGYYGLINWASQFEAALADFDNYRVNTWDDGGFSGQQSAANRPALALPAQLPTADLKALKPLAGVEKVE